MEAPLTEIEEARRSSPAVPVRVSSSSLTDLAPAPVVFDIDKLELFYGALRAVRDVSLSIHKQEITAFIGPSGCGKTTVLRCLNRMNDLVPGARVGGQLRYHGVDLYGEDVSAT